MNRRQAIISAAAALFLPVVNAQPVVGALPSNRYANAVNWTLDPVTHPVAPLPSLDRALIALWLGQSNMGQYANAVYQTAYPDRQYQLLYGDGTLRRFVEPAFGVGAAPGMGSWFGRFGDLMIESGRADRVIHCFASIGGTLASDWGPAGRYHSILTTAMFRLLDAGLMPTFVGVGQGEAETFYGKAGAQWLEPWTKCVQVSRSIGLICPWYFARQTYSMGAINQSVRAAQRAIAAYPGVRAGPDLDVFGSGYRYDDTHWNAEGIDAVGTAWANIAEGLL